MTYALPHFGTDKPWSQEGGGLCGEDEARVGCWVSSLADENEDLGAEAF